MDLSVELQSTHILIFLMYNHTKSLFFFPSMNVAVIQVPGLKKTDGLKELTKLADEQKQSINTWISRLYSVLSLLEMRKF